MPYNEQSLFLNTVALIWALGPIFSASRRDYHTADDGNCPFSQNVSNHLSLQYDDAQECHRCVFVEMYFVANSTI